ncbi:OST-HTH/LOTUS domain-containing protein [Amycolatopsis sp. NPDC057786]|uniref:OST-HTH/LOTUS domain-containing protein n=1 Tax=Amycolatopsis sp. NPDC057786 TaxID=3346250 RepID=UPI00366D870E
MYGFGERKTPQPFVAACDKFIYTENLIHLHNPTAPVEADPKPKAAMAGAQLKADTALVNQLRNAVEAASDDDGWAALAAVGSIITKQRPDFDPRNYGYPKLSGLITATTLFEQDRRSPGDGKPAVIYIRDKRRRPAG